MKKTPPPPMAMSGHRETGWARFAPKDHRSHHSRTSTHVSHHSRTLTTVSQRSASEEPSRSCRSESQGAGTHELGPQPRLRFGLPVDFGQLAASGVDEPVADLHLGQRGPWNLPPGRAYLAHRQLGCRHEDLLFVLGRVRMADMVDEPGLQTFGGLSRQVPATFGPLGCAYMQRGALHRDRQSMPPVGGDPASLAPARSSLGRRPPRRARRWGDGRTIDVTAGGDVEEVADGREPRRIRTPSWAGAWTLALVDAVDRRQHRIDPILLLGLVGRRAVGPMTVPPVRSSGGGRQRAVSIVTAGWRRGFLHHPRRESRHRIQRMVGNLDEGVHPPGTVEVDRFGQLRRPSVMVGHRLSGVGHEAYLVKTREGNAGTSCPLGWTWAQLYLGSVAVRRATRGWLAV